MKTKLIMMTNEIYKQKYSSSALIISKDNQKFLEYGALSDQLKETRVTVSAFLKECKHQV